MNIKTKEYLKKNWKSIVFVLVIAGLILFNVRQYKTSRDIYDENVRINTEYQESLKREKIYGEQIANYKTEIAKKDSAIKYGKLEIAQTEKELQVSQNQVKSLSKRILNGNTSNPDSLKTYIQTCDSLAVIAPILSDQVDTLKVQNKTLVATMDQKSALQDSIIKTKDVIINDKNKLLGTAIDDYNKSVDKLKTAEDKLVKEKKRKSFWKKVAIGLGLVAGGVILAK